MFGKLPVVLSAMIISLAVALPTSADYPDVRTSHHCRNAQTNINFPQCTVERVHIPLERYTIRAPVALQTVRDRLYKEVGSPDGNPLDLEQMRRAITMGKQNFENWIKAHSGPSGLILFQTFQHGGWFSLYGYDTQAYGPQSELPVSKGTISMVICNPLHLKDIVKYADTGFGPFLSKPNRVLLFDHGNPRESFIMYDKSSTAIMAGTIPAMVQQELRKQDTEWEKMIYRIAFGP